MEKDIDIIVYGATGFTGKLCVEYLASEERPTKWAIAGRNQDKLKKVADELSDQIKSIMRVRKSNNNSPLCRYYWREFLG